MRHFLFVFLLVGINSLFSQNITAEQLLNKAIAYHDPNGNWGKLQETMHITMSYADGRERESEIEVDMIKNYFKLTSKMDGKTIEQLLDGSECILKLNGSSDFSEEDIKKNRLTCDRAAMMKNYYLYLYGLPMKLKDQGTNLDPVVRTRKFKGKAYNVLKVTYDAEVGDDIWYFYFDPKTNAMEVYQFYHDESKKDGEYILLSDMETIDSIKMPKVRAWYYNSDDTYLGTDTLKVAE